MAVKRKKFKITIKKQSKLAMLAIGLAVFLFGSFDWLFIAITLLIGIYMLFKGESPSFWSTKFVGLFFLSIAMIGIKYALFGV